jgi:uncharacterized protein with HEPN domain
MNVAESIERIEYHNSRIQTLKHELCSDEELHSAGFDIEYGTEYAIQYNYKALARSVGANYGVFEKYFGPNTYRISDRFVNEDFILRCEDNYHLLLRELPKVEKFVNYIAIAKDEITKNKERPNLPERAFNLEKIESLRLMGYEEAHREKAYNDYSKTDKSRLSRIVRVARLGQFYVEHGKAEFESNLCFQEAIYRNMQIIGNQVDNLSPRVRQLNVSAWKRHIKYCDRLTNNELIDPKALWKDATRDLSALLNLCDSIKGKLFEANDLQKESKKVLPFKLRTKENEIDRLL